MLLLTDKNEKGEIKMEESINKHEKETYRKLIGYKQAAEVLGLTVSTLYSKVCRKEIPHYRFSGRCVRFDLDELEKWIDEHRVR